MEEEESERADPEKVKAIVDLVPPTSVKEVRRFLGMVPFNHLHQVQNFLSAS